jgi:hypothetical protein
VYVTKQCMQYTLIRDDCDFYKVFFLLSYAMTKTIPLIFYLLTGRCVCTLFCFLWWWFLFPVIVLTFVALVFIVCVFDCEHRHWNNQRSRAW